MAMSEQPIPIDTHDGVCTSRPYEQPTGGLEGTPCLFFVPLSSDLVVKSFRRHSVGLPD